MPSRDAGDRVDEAIRKVGEGHADACDPALTSLMETISAGSASPLVRSEQDPDELSPAEQEVSELIAGGQSNRQIADRLMLSDSTVRTHVQSIFAKLQLMERVQAAADALRTQGNAPSEGPGV